MTKSTTISIYFADTGGGHRSAANAVKAAIEGLVSKGRGKQGPVHIFSQPIVEKSHPIMFWLVTIYNYLARHHTTWIKYFYMLAHIFRPESEAYLDLYRAYLRDLIKTLQVIFLSGNNKDLQQNAIMAAEETGICTCVLPFSDKISDLMASVDVMVTKAGELTSYETLARRLPVVLDNTIEPMPQEAPTMEALVGLGIAEKLNHPDDIIPIIDRLRARSNRRKPLPEQHQLDLTDHAVFDIESSLLRLIDKQAHADQSQSFREAA